MVVAAECDWPPRAQAQSRPNAPVHSQTLAPPPKGLLGRRSGPLDEPIATISQMRSLTGWQAHTVRGTISGALPTRLGLNVVCNSMNESGARIYRIVAAQASA